MSMALLSQAKRPSLIGRLPEPLSVGVYQPIRSLEKRPEIHTHNQITNAQKSTPVWEGMSFKWLAPLSCPQLHLSLSYGHGSILGSDTRTATIHTPLLGHNMQLVIRENSKEKKEFSFVKS